LEVTPQERVNLEMFKAIETLGRRLERAESERDRLAVRLAQIESSATLDAKTGRLYLPVVVDPQQARQIAGPSRWMLGASLATSALALFALGFSVLREPPQSQLSPRQMAALTVLSAPGVIANLEAPHRWKSLNETEGEEAVKTAAAVPAPAPVSAPVTEVYGPQLPPGGVAANKESGVAANSESGVAALEKPNVATQGESAASTSIENVTAAVTAVPVGPVVPAVQIGPEVSPAAKFLNGHDSPEPAETPPAQTAAAKPVAKATAKENPDSDVIEETPEEAAGMASDAEIVQALPKPAAKIIAAAPAKPAPPKAAAAKPADVKTPPQSAAKKPEQKIADKAPEKPAAKPVAETAKAEKKPVAAPAQAEPVIAADKDLPSKLADLEKRAFAGQPEAQHDLAAIYAAGKVVSQDYKRAVYWFSRAADGGIANADYNLGVMFQQGMGVHKDVPRALEWYVKAAELGHPEAMYNLGIAYVEGIGTGRDVQRGVSYFKKAANAGVAQAAYNLGVLYESNFVGPIDLAKAAEWYQVAADQGHLDARKAAERVKQQMADSTHTGDQGLKLATAVEPAAGNGHARVQNDEADGEGDASGPGDTKVTGVAKATVVTSAGALPEMAALVRRIQTILIAHGDLPGTPTGAMDQKTEDAIRAWQTRLGLPVTGQPSQILLDKIAAAVGK
jgi:TPR repeat protein